MKKIKLKTILFVVISLLVNYAQAQQTNANLLQEDLKYLKTTIHTKYSNLFYNITADDWDKQADELNKQLPSMNSEQALAGFVKLIALFHIGHTQVNTFNLHQHGSLSNEKAPGTISLLHRYPFELYWFSDGLYIKSADKGYAGCIGGKVTMIGNMKTNDAIEAVRPLVSYENEQGFKSNCTFFLQIPEYLKTQNISNNVEEVSIKYLKDGKEASVVFKKLDFEYSGMTGLEATDEWMEARKNNSTPLWMKEPDAYRYMEYLPESKTLYVRHSVISNDGKKTIADFFKRMVNFIDSNNVHQLILDVRMNGGGNNYHNKETVTSIIKSRKINEKGKFFCIIGRRTFSACQNLVNALEKYTEVIFVGEPTSENINFYGDTKTETLPNSKLQVNLSWLWWQDFDARDKRKFTSPELATDMSFDDFYNNIDPAMNAIYNYQKEKPLLVFLNELLESGKNEEAFQYANDYKNNPLHRYVREQLEVTINAEAYRIMQTNLKTASFMLEINMKLFPESANTYDSYAESLMNIGKKEEAIKYYEIAIPKDKDGFIAENSKKQIDKIRKKQ